MQKMHDRKPYSAMPKAAPADRRLAVFSTSTAISEPLGSNLWCLGGSYQMSIGIQSHTSKFLTVKITCNRAICPALADLTDTPHARNGLRK